jgi:hypothetical protein
VATDHSLQTVTFEAIHNADSIGFVGDRLLECWQVLLMIDHLQVSNRGSSPPDDRAASSEEITGVTQFGRIEVSRGKVSATEQHGEFFRIDAIGSCFATVNGFEIQCMAEEKRQILCCAEIGKPVPVERGFAADDEIVTGERLQRDEKSFGGFGVEILMEVFDTGVINDADVHRIGVEVDPAAEFVLLMTLV